MSCDAWLCNDWYYTTAAFCHPLPYRCFNQVYSIFFIAVVGCIATFLAFRAPLLVYICLSCDWVKGNLRKKKYGVTNKLAQGTDLNTSANPISTPRGSWCWRPRASGDDNEHKLKEQRRMVEELNNRASVRRHLEVQGKHLRPDIWLWQIFGAMVHQGRSFIFSWWRHDIETFPYY